MTVARMPAPAPVAAPALAPHHGAWRVLRGSMLAAVNALLAVAAHVAAGAAVPDRTLTILATLGVAAAGTALADRRRGPLALLAAVTVTQVLLHLLLAAPGGHHHTMAMAATPAGTPAGTTAGTTAGVAGAAAMTAAHAVAVVVTAALLAGAESALFTVAGVLRRIAGVFVALRAPQRAERRTSTLPVVAAPSARLRQLCCAGISRRGPPRWSWS